MKKPREKTSWKNQVFSRFFHEHTDSERTFFFLPFTVPTVFSRPVIVVVFSRLALSFRLALFSDQQHCYSLEQQHFILSTSSILFSRPAAAFLFSRLAAAFLFSRPAATLLLFCRPTLFSRPGVFSRPSLFSRPTLFSRPSLFSRPAVFPRPALISFQTQRGTKNWILNRPCNKQVNNFNGEVFTAGWENANGRENIAGRENKNAAAGWENKNSAAGWENKNAAAGRENTMLLLVERMTMLLLVERIQCCCWSRE